MKRISGYLIFCVALILCVVQTYGYNYGDSNGDGYITANDATLLQQKILDRSYVLPVENELNILDLDNNGILSAFDCTLIIQKTLDGSFVFPCESSTATTVETTTETTEITTETEPDRNITIVAEGRNFNATIYDNPAGNMFLEQLPLTIDMEELNGNEKYFYFNDIVFPASGSQVEYINSGDIMLYGNDCLVLFYESFSTPYSYTPIGYVENPTQLSEALGEGNITVTFR